MCVRKVDVGGQSHSKLGKQGVGVDEGGLQSMQRGEGHREELCGGLAIATSSIPEASAFDEGWDSC